MNSLQINPQLILIVRMLSTAIKWLYRFLSPILWVSITGTVFSGWVSVIAPDKAMLIIAGTIAIVLSGSISYLMWLAFFPIG